MKAAILYVLLICFWFLGAQNSVLAGSSHPHRAGRCLVTKYVKEKDRFIDAEDQNDEDELTKKVTSAGKWLSAFNCEFILPYIDGFSNSFSPDLHSYSGRGIYIVQRVLRI